MEVMSKMTLIYWTWRHGYESHLTYSTLYCIFVMYVGGRYVKVPSRKTATADFKSCSCFQRLWDYLFRCIMAVLPHIHVLCQRQNHK